MGPERVGGPTRGRLARGRAGAGGCGATGGRRGRAVVGGGGGARVGAPVASVDLVDGDEVVEVGGHLGAGDLGADAADAVEGVDHDDLGLEGVGFGVVHLAEGGEDA